MKTKLLIVFVAILVLGGLVWVGRSKQSESQVESAATTSKGVLAAVETNYDFGTVSMADGKVKHDFRVKNTGSESVVIKKLYTSCMCTTASLLLGGKKIGPFSMMGHGFIPAINEEVQPNEEFNIEAIFDPNAHGPAGVGKIERVISLENNAGGPLELNFSAMVTP